MDSPFESGFTDREKAIAKELHEERVRGILNLYPEHAGSDVESWTFASSPWGPAQLVNRVTGARLSARANGSRLGDESAKTLVGSHAA